MGIGPGARVGPYEVATLIGEGGMGKVYRATDTSLKRTVAIKVLPETVATDPDRLARFQREAEVLARLNHPNIAQIHGLEKSDGTTALVMELVEGPTLADRIALGVIPIGEALPIAKQIAEALEAAHEQGIIHRDLKPANIKIRADGTVKVLDFGLAKAMDARPEGRAYDPPGLSQSPTITTPAMTQAGVVLGTAAYMSPEQARGKTVDKRADIWAFGCVLFEMMTGAAPFVGEDIAETIGAVIHREPPWSDLPTATPRPVRAILQRCLDKDSKNRLRDIGEARIALDGARTVIDDPPATSAASRFRWFPWAAAAAATVVAVLSVFWQRNSDPEVVTRFSFGAPEHSTFPIPAPMMAISPDGRNLAFVAVDERGKSALWYRTLDALNAVSLSGTDGASDPFWSADSRFVGYFADGKLSTVDISSGRLQKIWDGNGLGGTWRGDGLIVFGTTKGLFSVHASGGEPSTVIDNVRAPGQSNWHSPKFLPDGRHILYIARAQNAPSYQAYVAALDAGAPQYLMDVQSKLEYVEPGWIFYVANGRLLTQRFDAQKLVPNGEPIALAGDLLGSARNGRKAFTASSGVLAFRERRGNSKLELRDRSGKVLSHLGQTGDLYPVAFSADDKRLLFRRNEDVWILDLSGGQETRITFDASGNVTPVWSPDMAWIAFRRGGRVKRIRADGSGTEEDLGEAGGALTQWLPDGTGLISEALPLSAGRLSEVRLQGQGSVERVSGVPLGAREGQVSPDGKWLAYAYAERGDSQIYVQSLTVSGGRSQVSQNGGRQPRWRRDGRELFYLSADGNVTAAEIRAEKGFTVASTRALFDIGAGTGLPNNIGFHYDVSSDGQRFVFSTEFYQQIQTPITFVLNWHELVMAKDR